jgi:hypothetical protein
LLIVKFLEDAEPSGSAHPHKLKFEEALELAKSPPHRGRLIVFRENQIDYPEPQSVLEQPTHSEQVQNKSILPLQNAEEVELRKFLVIMLYISKSLMLTLDIKMIQNCFRMLRVEKTPHYDSMP